MKKIIKQSGFTLLELVVAITVLSIMSLVIANFMLSSVKSFQETQDNILALSKLHYLDQRLVKELRQVNHNGTDYDVATMTATQIQFTDINGNTVTFGYDGASDLDVTYSTPVLTRTISNQVSAMSFSYYQADAITAATGAGDVTFIEYSISLTENGATYSLQNRIFLRDQIS